MAKSFTDQKPRVATESDCAMQWGFSSKRGEGFRCYMCGHRFVPGDTWRWVYANGGGAPGGNFLVCVQCDGEDVLERRRQLYAEFHADRFWSFRVDS